MENDTQEYAMNPLDKKKDDEPFRDKENSKTPVPFWAENPNILLNPAYLTEFYPSADMSYSQKLNAITRMIVALTICLFLIVRTTRTILFGLMSIGVVYLVHYYYSVEKQKTEKRKDAFTGLGGQTKTSSPAISVLEEDMDGVSPGDVFDAPTAKNPFSNVLVTDINGNPMKKPAPPAYNDQVNQSILAAAKDAVGLANPGQPDISDKLFKDLGEQLTFEQSMRQFYSNPATTTPDDQQAFAEFCYGSMISCKEGNKFACARTAASTRHTMV
jgi:hypothetical protein